MVLKQLTPINTTEHELAKQRRHLNTKDTFACITGMLFMCILIMSLMVVKASSTAAFYQNQTAAALSIRNLKAKADLVATSAYVAEPFDIAAKKVARSAYRAESKQQGLVEAEKELRAHLTMEQQRQHKLVSHAYAGDNAYLVERGSAASFNEQPIYGTWRTKARRPQAPIIPAPSSMADEKLHETAEPEQYHLYERLPRRLSTVLPMKNDLHEQIPRPPRLTSRQPSLSVRRQHMDVPMNVTMSGELKPKPFHFPFEGPMPEKFKKTTAEVNNIQDILQQLHLNGMPPAVPQMMMMPTGLHIAGSFKNLKSSGITNLFRSKRHKKQLPPQLLPVSMSLPLPLPVFLPQPYQRIAMDQFYAFKPRSPSDINLLAMHQQLKTQRAKNKKKHKQSNLMLQHSTNQLPFAAEPYAQHYPQIYAVNVTQKPQKPKRLPFKVNLDIFPVMPPLKDYKSTSFTPDEARVPTSSRPPTALRSPYHEYNPYALTPSAAALVYAGQYEQPFYAPVKFPAALPTGLQQLPQSSNIHYNIPDQTSKYMQQHQQQQPHILRQHSQQYLVPSSNPQTPFLPIDCVHPSTASNNVPVNQKSNPIMVHLNVFPKSQKSAGTSTPLPSTNPFYSHGTNINRNTIYEEPEASVAAPQPFQNISNAHQQPPKQHIQLMPRQPQDTIARSDDSVDDEPLVDFEHPIVASDITEMPVADALVSNKLDATDNVQHYENREPFSTNRANFAFQANTNVEQLASEAQTASLFRFPVDNLIQFHVDDAV